MIDRRWVLLEEGYPHTVLLTKEEAEEMAIRHRKFFPDLEYSLFYDEYYEYSEIVDGQ